MYTARASAGSKSLPSGKAQADDFCLNSDSTKCLNGVLLSQGYGGYTFYINGHSDKLMYGMGVVSGSTFSGTAYCNPDTVHYSCGYASNLHCPQTGAYADKQECTFYYGATYTSGGLYRYQVDVEGIQVNTVTKKWGDCYNASLKLIFGRKEK